MRARTIFFIGGGNMASAIISGLDRNDWKVIVAESFELQRKNLIEKFGVRTVATSNDPSISDADVIVFSVKPQSFPEVVQQISAVDFSNKIVLSIMAGIPVDTILSNIKGENVKYARLMPNLPLMIGKGTIGAFLQDSSLKPIITSLLAASAKIFYFEKEDDLNIVTAISGSGPAYFFAFMEALIKVGISMGLSPEMASELCIETALGASTFAANSSDSIETLRENVTCKGGTTYAALTSFASDNLDKIVSNAVNAAFERSKELEECFKTKR